MEKVLIIGCPGSGKSTFARKLRDATGLPLFYLDRIWHREDRTTVPREEFDRKLEEILRLDRWILDGNYSRTLEKRLRHCDTVFFFDLPTELCLRNVSERVGKEREDMPWTEKTLDEDFRSFILNFRTDKRPDILEKLKKLSPDRTVTVFQSLEETDRFLEDLKNQNPSK